MLVHRKNARKHTVNKMQKKNCPAPRCVVPGDCKKEKEEQITTASGQGLPKMNAE
jgi:hypothetical protein